MIFVRFDLISIFLLLKTIKPFRTEHEDLVIGKAYESLKVVRKLTVKYCNKILYSRVMMPLGIKSNVINNAKLKMNTI